MSRNNKQMVMVMVIYRKKEEKALAYNILCLSVSGEFAGLNGKGMVEAEKGGKGSSLLSKDHLTRVCIMSDVYFSILYL
ncbi:hypothetical protein HN51_038853 [Arachis hypogaea]